MTTQTNNNPPEWATAPEWANYRAQDEDGKWHWYENEPDKGRFQWQPNGGRWELVDGGWLHSLTPRPKDA